MAHTSWYERPECRRSGQACMTQKFSSVLLPANFQSLTLVIARSWWIHSSLDPNLRHWSRIISPTRTHGSRCSAISSLTPRKLVYWVAFFGCLTGNSFRRSFRDSGAHIACCGESRPLSHYLDRSPKNVVHVSPSRFGQRGQEKDCGEQTFGTQFIGH